MLDKWDDSFQGCEPIAHLLRLHFPDRWIRFHSLPESKRYAEDEREYQILLGRHNAVLEDLAESGAILTLLSVEFFEAETSRELKMDTRAKLWRTVSTEDGIRKIFAREVAWQPKALDSVICAAADDVVSGAMVIDRECRWIYHPYDGGMDLILDSTEAREALKTKFQDWLSPYPGGL